MQTASSLIRPRPSRRTFICVLAAAGLTLSMPIASAGAQSYPVAGSCTDANTQATAASVPRMDKAVDCLINQQRVEHGLPAMGLSFRLGRSAQKWNTAMVASGNFTHGANFAGRISAVGYNWQRAGENIATGFATPAKAVIAWMASTDHCRNILDPSFRNMGTGETPARVGTWSTEPATWTQDFGLRMSQSALSAKHGPQNGCPYASGMAHSASR
jgi:uncharacterized protein YkwD